MTSWWSIKSLGSLGVLLALLSQAQAGRAQTADAPPPFRQDAIVRVFSEAETHSGSVARKEYGPVSSSTVISYLDLHPTDSAVSYSSDTANGSRWNTGGGSYLYADLHGIPHGALITQVDFYFIDNDATADFQGFVGYYFATSNGSGTPFGGSSLVGLSSSGMPGDGVLSQSLDITYSEALDANNDGLPDAVHWWVAVGVPTSGTRIKMIRIQWKRQISPAPSVATFADVPINDPNFRYIEAFYAAGITAGCGGNPPRFCPNSALTRRQLATFLSVALGLQWP